MVAQPAATCRRDSCCHWNYGRRPGTPSALHAWTPSTRTVPPGCAGQHDCSANPTHCPRGRHRTPPTPPRQGRASLRLRCCAAAVLQPLSAVFAWHDGGVRLPAASTPPWGSSGRSAEQRTATLKMQAHGRPFAKPAERRRMRRGCRSICSAAREARLVLWPRGAACSMMVCCVRPSRCVFRARACWFGSRTAATASDARCSALLVQAAAAVLTHPPAVIHCDQPFSWHGGS